MNTLIEHLAGACRTHRVQEKWLIVPSLRVGHQWLDQVVRAGTPVVNAHVLTVQGLAIQVLGPRLVEDGRKVASQAARRLVVAAAWERAIGDGGYLGDARFTPGLLALAEATILDMRQAGLEPGDLAAGGLEHGRKGRELAALLTAYVQELGRRGLIDHADAARLAAEQLVTSGAVGPDIVILRPDDLRLSVVEKKLLDALAGATVVDLPVDRPAVGDPPETVVSDLALLRWLHQPTDAPQPVGDGSMRIVHAVGEVNEVRGALRSCLAGGVSLDTVELLYTAADPYVPLIYETALRVFEPGTSQDLGVPVTFADGVPVRLSRPGRLLAAWHGWIRDDFPQSGLLRMFQAELLRLPDDDGVGRVTSSGLVRMFRSVGIGFGRERYAPRLAEKVRSIGRRNVDAGGSAPARRQRLETARALSSVVDALIAVSPEPPSDAARPVIAARTLIAEHARISSTLDGLARHRLLQEFDGMIEALAADPDPAGFDAWQWLEELPDRVTAGGSGPRPGLLHVASVGSGGHSGRDHTLVLGLDDGRFPSAGRQDPLLLDRDREGLAGELPTSKTRLHEQVAEFGRLLCRLRGHLTLSFSSRSIDDDRETFAGPVVLASYRIVSGRRDSDHAALMKWLDPAISFAPREADSCLDAGEWWLHHAAGERPVENLAELAGAEFGHLARGRAAAAARASDAFTIYDGLVEEPGAELDLAGQGGPVVSVTGDLQAIGRCPLKYFYAKVLGITPPDDVEVDPDVWLDPMEMGSLLHAVLFEFVAALLAEDAWPPEPDRDLPRMAAIVEAEAAATRQRIPPPAEAAYRRQRRLLDAGAEIFVREQARRARPGRPVYLEASIGLPGDDRPTDLDAPEPVEVPLPGGGAIRARCRIDRIDRAEDGRTPVFTLYDYKSGSYTKEYDPADPFKQGRLVQHVLYMAVAGAALRAHVDPAAVIDEFRFVFPGVRTWGREIAFDAAIVEPGLGVIEKLCRLPAAGVFPATDEINDCRYCEYRAACQAVDRDLADLCAASARKIDNPANTALAPFAELRRDQ